MFYNLLVQAGLRMLDYYKLNDMMKGTVYQDNLQAVLTDTGCCKRQHSEDAEQTSKQGLHYRTTQDSSTNQ